MKVGSTLTVTMVMSMASPHLSNLFFLHPFEIIKRKYFWKRYKTQHELNLAFKGPEFDLATKMATILSVVFSCFLYSSGIPLMN